MICKQIVFREHALLRMVARRITQQEVEIVLAEHRIVAESLTDKPFPSKLLLGSLQGKPLHVVVAQDYHGRCFIITVYQPDPLIWNDDFSLKKP